MTGTSDVEAVLYPHYVGHPIGIGMPFILFRQRETETRVYVLTDLHESSEQYRSRPYVVFVSALMPLNILTYLNNQVTRRNGRDSGTRCLCTAFAQFPYPLP